MIKNTRFILIGFALVIVSCKGEINVENISQISSDDSTLLVNESIDTAQLMINNCYSCHNPNSTGKDKIAPNLSHIKQKYLEKNATQKDFELFVANPTIDNSLLKGAADKFGVMPNMQFPIADIEQISAYIFNNNIESDTWMAKYFNGAIAEPTFEEGDYLGLGRHIAMSTKKELGKNLKQTIKNQGTLKAVKYCNIRALSITDSMTTKYSTNIVRVSNNQRNPINFATKKEADYISTYQTQLDNGEELSPILIENSVLATFYMPIVTNDMCLQCHGSESEIEQSVLSEINTLYPKDRATGYDINQIRGLWRIEMEKK